MLLSKKLTVITVLMIILCCRYYDTEDFSLISIIVTLNITIHGNINIVNIDQPYVLCNHLYLCMSCVCVRVCVCMCVYACVYNTYVRHKTSP